MSYRGLSIGVWTLTMSGMFTLDGVYVPPQKQTGNLQGGGKGADHGLRAFNSVLQIEFVVSVHFPLKSCGLLKEKAI